MKLFKHPIFLGFAFESLLAALFLFPEHTVGNETSFQNAIGFLHLPGALFCKFILDYHGPNALIIIMFFMLSVWILLFYGVRFYFRRRKRTG